MATILKSDGEVTRQSAPQTVAFNFGDVTDKAQSYLQQVREQAAQIIANAHAEAQQIRNQARHEGAVDARAEAESNVQQMVGQQLQFLVPAIQEAVDQVDAQRELWMARWESDALKIATAIASRAIRRELQHSPEITVDLLREALQLASGLGTLKVHLSPGDYESLKDNLDEVIGQIQKLTSAEVIADAAISPGGCRVDTDYGVIDQQIETQLQRILEEISPEA